MRNKKLVLVAVCACAVVTLAYALWPEGYDAAVQRHRSAMEVAWQRYTAEPAARENFDTFVHHRDELVRLGNLQRKTYQVPVKFGTPRCKDLIAALIDRADSRPMCEWSPTPTATMVTTYASAAEVTQWESMLSKWNTPR